MINLLVVIAFFLVISSYFFAKEIALVTIGSALMFFGTGFIFPMAMGKGMSLFRHIAGTASAVMYLVNMLLTSLSSFLISFMNIQSAIPLMWIYFSLILIGTLIYWALIHSSASS